MKKPHAHLQSYIKTCVKFQKGQPKTVRGVALTRYMVLKILSRNQFYINEQCDLDL